MCVQALCWRWVWMRGWLARVGFEQWAGILLIIETKLISVCIAQDKPHVIVCACFFFNSTAHFSPNSNRSTGALQRNYQFALFRCVCAALLQPICAIKLSANAQTHRNKQKMAHRIEFHSTGTLHIHHWDIATTSLNSWVAEFPWQRYSFSRSLVVVLVVVVFGSLSCLSIENI